MYPEKMENTLRVIIRLCNCLEYYWDLQDRGVHKLTLDVANKLVMSNYCTQLGSMHINYEKYYLRSTMKETTRAQNP